MSYVSAVAVFVLVLFPVFIPLTVTGVHAIAKWRQNFRTVRKVTATQSRAVTVG
jgi:hypothetical protein